MKTKKKKTKKKLKQYKIMYRYMYTSGDITMFENDNVTLKTVVLSDEG